MDSPKKTPLADVHEALGAKMIDFNGWWMPIQYSSIVQEHHAVRRNVGLFDLSHMGEIEVTGPGAGDFLQRIITNDLDRLRDGSALYTPMCLPAGGVVDDLIVYRFSQERYRLIPNASNIEKDEAWLREHAPNDATITNLSDDIALIAAQGPNCAKALAAQTNADFNRLRYMSFLPQTTVGGVTAMVSRTGYTGERGYELYCAAKDAETLWNALHETVDRQGGLACGLGARDTLRLEARLCLYGNDLDETTTPIEAGLSWTVAFDKPDFIGREALAKQKETGPSRRLMGFQTQERAVARPHCEVVYEGEKIGEVASGGPSPTLGVNIGLAYIDAGHAKIGRRVGVIIRNVTRPAKIVRTPFYTSSSD